MIALNIAVAIICGFIAYSVRNEPNLRFSFWINTAGSIINVLVVLLHIITFLVL